MREAGAQKRGCLFYGCLTLGVCAAMGIVVGYFGVRYAMSATQRMANDYTDSAPALIAVAPLPEAERAALRERVNAFQSALNAATHPARAGAFCGRAECVAR